jgi:hypothetical protein
MATPRSARRRASLAFLVLLLPTAGRAAGLPIQVVDVSSPVARGANAVISIRTRPIARCTLKVDYMSAKTGKVDGSVTFGPHGQIADLEGRVAWQWPVPAKASPGPAPVLLSCEKGADKGELRTSVEVR